MSADDLDGGDTHALLMEAAYHTLCDYGYADFSLRKVAAEAEKSRGLVHYHFDSKDDLLASLLDHLIREFESRFDGDGADRPIERLRAVLEWVAFGPELEGRDGDAYFTALFELRAQAPYDDELRKRLTRNYEAVRNRCADAIRTGVEDGEFEAVDPERTAAFLVSAVDGARNAELTLDADGTREAALAAIEEFVFDVLVE